MNPAEVRWQLGHAASVAAALASTLTRALDACDGAEPGVVESVRLAAKDADLLETRVRAVRRYVEAVTPPPAA